jgi:peptidoglycan-N-acetylglucosamine deacetylase
MTWLNVIETAAVAAGMGSLYYACSVPKSQVLGRSLVRGPAEGRKVALTFDDGPAPPFTDQILDILRDHKVPATFFVCGQNVDRNPEALRRIHAEKHGIGNHTYSHPFLYFKSHRRISREIDRTQAAIERVTGIPPRIFRPPYGIRWFGLFPVLRQRGMQLIQWSDAGFDWIEKNSPADIARLSLKGLRAGAVILLHDGRNALPPDQFDRSRTVAALPAIIKGVQKAGFTLVPIQEFVS